MQLLPLQDEDGIAPLYMAAGRGIEDAVDELLQVGIAPCCSRLRRSLVGRWWRHRSPVLAVRARPTLPARVTCQSTDCDYLPSPPRLLARRPGPVST